MAKSNFQKLKKHFAAVAACRECNLPAGYFPQLRPPGPGYHPGGVVFVQINPGHIESMNEAEIAKRYKSEHGRNTARLKAADAKRLKRLHKAFAKRTSSETYENMRDAFMESMANIWGWPPGKYGKTIEAHGVDLNDIAVMNLAQCPVPKESNKSKQLQRCWNKWGYQQLEILQPSLIVAQGKQAYNFLMETGLPYQIQVVEGMHHADRRSRKRKDQLLEYVRRQIEANE